MDLIAKVLNFNDDQKVAVGLKIGAIGFRHAVGSIFKTIVGTSPTKSAQDVEGDNLAELWVNFLLTETGDDRNGTQSMASGNSPLSIAIQSRMAGIGSSESDNDVGDAANSNEDHPGGTDIALTPPSPTIARLKNFWKG